MKQKPEFWEEISRKKDPHKMLQQQKNRMNSISTNKEHIFGNVEVSNRATNKRSTHAETTRKE